MKRQSIILWGIWVGFHLAGCAPDLKTTGAGGAGGGGVGGTGGESASSSGMPGVELCDDGVDNDGDSLIDCADAADCGTLYSCNPTPPDGWTYVRMRRPSFGSTPVPCADGSDPQRFLLEPAKSSCMPCNCQVAGDCTSTITCYLQMGCTSLSGSRSYSTTGQCMSLMNGVPLMSCQIDGTGDVPPMTTCSTTGGTVMNENPFMKEAHVCPAMVDTAGCGGQTCVETAKMPYENRLCIMQPGASVCPAGFTETYSTFSSYTDTRACSSCACDNTQIKCSGPTTFELWGDAACTTNGQVVATADGCVDLTSNPTHISIMDLPNLMVPKPACTGGVASGSVVGTDPTTICCVKP